MNTRPWDSSSTMDDNREGKAKRLTVARTRKSEPTTAAEVALSACCLCVSCPLCILWCCIKEPSLICWRATRRFICCVHNRVQADYSSFSDIDSDNSNLNFRRSPSRRFP